VIGVTLVLGGVQLACIGIIGQYLGRIYDEIKNRPLFVVQEDTHTAGVVPRDPDRPLPQPAAPASEA
jgi:dolichol-phosphate mannosyltransferase